MIVNLPCTCVNSECNFTFRKETVKRTNSNKVNTEKVIKGKKMMTQSTLPAGKPQRQCI